MFFLRQRRSSSLRLFMLAFAAMALGSDAAHAVSIQAVLADTPPKQLSEFGFFADLRGQQPAAGVIPFRLATPLFSDGAEKFRFVYLPGGKPAKYDPTEAFDFPVGTALIKTFAFPADYRRPADDLELIETRLLLRHGDGWHAWAYLWTRPRATPR